MKTFKTIVLAAGILGSGICAGQTLTAEQEFNLFRAAEQARTQQATPQLKSSRDNRFFADLDSSVEVYATSRLGDTIAVGLKNHYFCDATKRLISDTALTFNKKTNRWEPYYITNTTYDQTNYVLNEERYEWDTTLNALWKSWSRETAKNSLGKDSIQILMNRLTIDVEESIWKTLLGYNAKGDNISSIEYKKTGLTWALWMKSSVLIDGNGYMSSLVTEIYGDGDTVISKLTGTAQYNAQGKITSYTRTNNNANESMYTVEYNADGSETLISYNWEGGQWQLYHTSTTLYNSSKRPIKSIYQRPGRVKTLTIDTYYDDNKQASSTTSEWDSTQNVWKVKYRYSFLRDAKNRPAGEKSEQYLEAENLWVTYRHIKTYYKLKTENLTIGNDNTLSITFDSPLVPNDSIAQSIVINSGLKASSGFAVQDAYVSKTDSFTLVVVFNRAIEDGEHFTISLSEGLKTEDGRVAKFQMSAGNASTADESETPGKVLVYPSLASDHVVVCADSEILSLRLLNSNGCELLKMHELQSTTISLPMSNQPAGLYYIQVSTVKGTECLPVVRK